MTLKGPPALLPRQIEFGAGLEAWRQLKNRYEGSDRGRQYALLTRILKPQKFPVTAKGFEGALSLWELDVSNYAAAAGEEISNSIKMHVLSEQAPQPIRNHIQLAQ